MNLIILLLKQAFAAYRQLKQTRPSQALHLFHHGCACNIEHSRFHITID